MGRCFVCGFNHPIKYCTHFRWMLKEERRAVLQKFRYCLNCLSDRHIREDCTSPRRCDVCGFKHHTMIHRDTVDPASASFEIADDGAVGVVRGNEEVAPLATDERNKNTAPVVGNEEIVPLATDTSNKNAAPIAGKSETDPLSTGNRAMSRVEKLTSDPAPETFARFGAERIAPVVLCQLRVGAKVVDATFLVNERVPRSCITFSTVERLSYQTQFKAGVPLGYFEIVTRSGRVLKHWLVIIDKLNVKHADPVLNHDLPALLSTVDLKAHPEPHQFKVVGVIGADICRYTLYGRQKSLPANPHIRLQESAFGTIACGIFARYLPGPRSGPGEC